MSLVLDQPVSATFRALGEPVRLTIVQHLATFGETSVNDLTALFPISVQAVSRHIQVLESAGIVSQRRDGRHRPVRLQSSRVADANGWLASRLSEVEARYRRLDDLLTELQADGT